MASALACERLPEDVAHPVRAEVTTGPDGIGYIGSGRDAAMCLLESLVPATVATPIPVRKQPLAVTDEWV